MGDCTGKLLENLKRDAKLFNYIPEDVLSNYRLTYSGFSDHEDNPPYLDPDNKDLKYYHDREDPFEDRTQLRYECKSDSRAWINVLCRNGKWNVKDPNNRLEDINKRINCGRKDTDGCKGIKDIVEVPKQNFNNFKIDDRVSDCYSNSKNEHYHGQKCQMKCKSYPHKSFFIYCENGKWIKEADTPDDIIKTCKHSCGTWKQNPGNNLKCKLKQNVENTDCSENNFNAQNYCPRFCCKPNCKVWSDGDRRCKLQKDNAHELCETDNTLANSCVTMCCKSMILTIFGFCRDNWMILLVVVVVSFLIYWFVVGNKTEENPTGEEDRTSTDMDSQNRTRSPYRPSSVSSHTFVDHSQFSMNPSRSHESMSPTRSRLSIPPHRLSASPNDSTLSPSYSRSPRIEHTHSFTHSSIRSSQAHVPSVPGVDISSTFDFSSTSRGISPRRDSYLSSPTNEEPDQ